MAVAARRLTTFVQPRPNRTIMAAVRPVNRILMLNGIPVLRDIPLLNRIPGIRGIANVRYIDFPKADEARLAALVKPGNATFLTPNHPEFFTDWMIDVEMASRVAPVVAAWATNAIVNGMGTWLQKFWLANNLIAQIPGNSQVGREYSVEWALKGHGVLLHPEGAVGWHGDWVAPLMPGAAEMALQALERGKASGSVIQAWVAPVVWKLAFVGDVGPKLNAECDYVERRLELPSLRPAATPAERIYAIYESLLARDEESAGAPADRNRPVAGRLDALTKELIARLTAAVVVDEEAPENAIELLKDARRWLRENNSERTVKSKAIAKESDMLQRLLRLGAFAWGAADMTQEQAAEHLKRIRNDYCFGGWRDDFNRLIPQPAGPRRAIIRVPEPIAVGEYNGDEEAIVAELRARLQSALDAINDDLRKAGKVRTYPNPFFQGAHLPGS